MHSWELTASRPKQVIGLLLSLGVMAIGTVFIVLIDPCHADCGIREAPSLFDRKPWVLGALMFAISAVSAATFIVTLRKGRHAILTVDAVGIHGKTGGLFGRPVTIPWGEAKISGMQPAGTFMTAGITIRGRDAQISLPRLLHPERPTEIIAWLEACKARTDGLLPPPPG